jgi:hypothetical protein
MSSDLLTRITEASSTAIRISPSRTRAQRWRPGSRPMAIIGQALVPGMRIVGEVLVR